MGTRHSTGKVHDLPTASSESPKPRAQLRLSLPTPLLKSSSSASASCRPEPQKPWQDINVAKAVHYHRRVTLKEVCLSSPHKAPQSLHSIPPLTSDFPSKPHPFISPAKVLLRKQLHPRETSPNIQFEQEDSVRAFYADSEEAKLRPIQLKSSSMYHLIKPKTDLTPTSVATSTYKDSVVSLLKEAAVLNNPLEGKRNERVVTEFASKSPVSALPTRQEGFGTEAERQLYRLRKQTEVVNEKPIRQSMLRLWKGHRGSIIETTPQSR